MNNELTDDQMEALARKIVDGWDMDTLVQSAVETLYEFYHDNPDFAQEEMENMEWTLEDLESLEF